MERFAPREMITCVPTIRNVSFTDITSKPLPLLVLLSRRPSSRRTPWQHKQFLSTSSTFRHPDDPRVQDLGRKIFNDFASTREQYAAPKHPIVLAHGLFGFSELKLTDSLSGFQYWRGIKAALEAHGATVITTSVPPSGSIESRAAKLSDHISSIITNNKFHSSSSSSNPNDRPPAAVNIIAHSMGGLDARYMASHLAPAGVTIKSITTVATPHRGSEFADHMLGSSAPIALPKLYPFIERLGLETDAFRQLTREYMTETFNPSVPDVEAVRYFSYGASASLPPLFSPFRYPWSVIDEVEGANDGLVSVESSRWGVYRGTLLGVSHLDLINWSNRITWGIRELMGVKRNFNAVAFYLDIADMLSKEGL